MLRLFNILSQKTRRTFGLLCLPDETYTLIFVVMIAVGSLSTFAGAANAQTLLPDFNFGAVGDWGCNSNSVSTVNNIIEKNTELVLGLGDYSYTSTADCWLSMVEPIDQKMKIAIGNHDDTSSAILDQFMGYFGLTRQYYSFNYQNVHFIVMSTELPYVLGSEQYDFVKKDLQKSSDDPDVDWIIVYFHKIAYTSPTIHAAIPVLRDTYHPLFDQYGVDLVLQGHNHNYQRSYLIKYNSADPSSPTVTDTATSRYKDPVGQIFVTVGTGGRSSYSFTGKAYYIYFQQSTNFGVLHIDMTNNGTTLNGRFYDNSGTLLDEFSISKQYHYKPSLQLTGTEYQDVPNVSELQLAEFTLSAWFRTDKQFPANAYIANKGGVGSETSARNLNYGLIMSSTGKILGGFETETGLDYVARSPSALNDGKWHYAAATYDGSQIKLYVDGVPVSAKATTGAMPDNNGVQPLRIGANSLFLSGYFVGSIDEVRLWNRELSAQEITNAYYSGVFNENGQVIHLPFEHN